MAHREVASPEHLLARDPAPPYAVIDDLLGRHTAARIGPRATPSIWPFWRRLADSAVGISGSRLGDAAHHPERFV